MEKDEAKELLVDAMGSLFAEVEIEAQIAEAAGISREKYNEILSADEPELPDCIKKYREANRKRKQFEEKIITHELRETGEFFSNPALNIVFALYPQFRKDYEVMKNNYFIVTETGLKWIKKKKCLAEYFGYQPILRTQENRDWKFIEILFGVTKLKNSFSRNGNSYSNKLSRDYEKLKNLLCPKNTPEGK